MYHQKIWVKVAAAPSSTSRLDYLVTMEHSEESCNDEKIDKKIDNDRLLAGALPPSPSDSGVSDVELSSSSQVGNKQYFNITI